MIAPWTSARLRSLLAALGFAGCASAPPPEPPPPPPAAEPASVERLLETCDAPDGHCAHEGAIAEVLSGDSNAMNARLAEAMGGEGTEFKVADEIPSGWENDAELEGDPADAASRVSTGRLPEGQPAGTGSMVLGKIAVAGGCATDPIEQRIARERGRLHACYERRLRSKRTLAGVAELHIAIDARGEVSHHAISELEDRELRSCLDGVASRMRFDPPGQVCVASFALTFAP